MLVHLRFLAGSGKAPEARSLEGGREAGREGERERGRERGREGGREGGEEGGRRKESRGGRALGISTCKYNVCTLYTVHV